MNFSDNLRIKLSKKYSINLESYVWDDELNDFILNIKLNFFEELIKTMAEVYKFGFNIGHCGLTSRYFALAFPKAKIAYGTLPILKGTKNSETGNHAWVINNDFILDTTLRLIIPENIATSIGYTTEKILDHVSARMFSEYELYSNSVLLREKNLHKYHEDLLNIK
ncbi:MAG: hypothetical protein PHD15_02240 [Clostridia bacterium]|nr:hypothetical protein [Clostridia bacterium]MDD4386566.1 hypothetical protein [Clostridia bacterium]